jgi:hypothetical protein
MENFYVDYTLGSLYYMDVGSVDNTYAASIFREGVNRVSQRSCMQD